MRTESDYRLLLEKAQEAVEQIDMLLAAIHSAPQSDINTREKVDKIRETLRSTEVELGQLWDEFKRLKPTQ
jgi:hypothetical protein